jgi:hypothetical protein
VFSPNILAAIVSAKKFDSEIFTITIPIPAEEKTLVIFCSFTKRFL